MVSPLVWICSFWALYRLRQRWRYRPPEAPPAPHRAAIPLHSASSFSYDHGDADAQVGQGYDADHEHLQQGGGGRADGQVVVVQRLAADGHGSLSPTREDRAFIPRFTLAPDEKGVILVVQEGGGGEPHHLAAARLHGDRQGEGAVQISLLLVVGVQS